MEADPEIGGSAGFVLEASPMKRQRTPSWKRKEKIEAGEEDAEASSPCFCGICLSEDGKDNRGVIDCCHHYFCFVCIMEWAKVESRCPMCKQRFTSIWRPMRLGSCLPERLVDVPVHDQARQKEAQSVDLYANIHCTICKLSGNDNVLLLIRIVLAWGRLSIWKFHLVNLHKVITLEVVEHLGGKTLVNFFKELLILNRVHLERVHHRRWLLMRRMCSLQPVHKLLITEQKRHLAAKDCNTSRHYVKNGILYQLDP